VHARKTVRCSLIGPNSCILGFSLHVCSWPAVSASHCTHYWLWLFRATSIGQNPVRAPASSCKLLQAIGRSLRSQHPNWGIPSLGCGGSGYWRPTAQRGTTLALGLGKETSRFRFPHHSDNLSLRPIPRSTMPQFWPSRLCERKCRHRLQLRSPLPTLSLSSTRCTNLLAVSPGTFLRSETPVVSHWGTRTMACLGSTQWDHTQMGFPFLAI